MTDFDTPLAAAFDHCQKTAAAHPGEIQKLVKLQEKNPAAFAEAFVEQMHHVMLMFKKEKSAENVVNFIIKFATHNKEHSEGGFSGSEFYLFLLDYLLTFTNVKERAVRYRCCQLLQGLLQNLGEDACIPDELFESYQNNLLERTNDKIPDVRLMAVQAIARLQDAENEDCPIVTKLTEMIQHDPTMSVRKAALSAVAISATSLTAVLSRTRDVKDDIRAEAYRILGEKILFSSFSREKLVDIVMDGLKDRVETVQKACADMLYENWFAQAKSLENLIHAFFAQDEEAEDPAFESRAIEASEIVIKKILEAMDRDGKRIRWDFLPASASMELTEEQVLIWRVHCEYAKAKIGKMANAADELEDLLPDIPLACLLIRKYEDNIFVCQELLKIASYIDLSDEGGRRILGGISRELLLSPTMSEEVIPLLMKQLARVYRNEHELIQLTLEIIADVREPLDMFCTEEAEMALQEQADRLVELNTLIEELQAEKEEHVENQEYAEAAKLKEELDKYQAEFDTLHATELDREDMEEYVYVRALSITEQLLSGTKQNLKHPGIAGLLEALLLPSVYNTNVAVRTSGLRCLGIFCLLDRATAIQYLPFIFTLSQNDEESVQAVCLKVTFDFLQVFGLQLLDEIHMEPAEQPEEGEEATNFRQEVWADLLGQLLGEGAVLRSIATEGFCKLIFSGVCEDTTVFSMLLSQFFDSSLEGANYIRQILSVFFNGLVKFGKNVVALCKDSILLAICNVIDKGAKEQIYPVFRFVLGLCDSAMPNEDARGVAPVESGKRESICNDNNNSIIDETRPVYEDVHGIIARNISEFMLTVSIVGQLRELARCLMFLHPSPQNQDCIRALRSLNTEHLKKFRVKADRSIIEKFDDYLAELIVETEEGEGDEEKVDDVSAKIQEAAAASAKPQASRKLFPSSRAKPVLVEEKEDEKEDEDEEEEDEMPTPHVEDQEHERLSEKKISSASGGKRKENTKKKTSTTSVKASRVKPTETKKAGGSAKKEVVVQKLSEEIDSLLEEVTPAKAVAKRGRPKAGTSKRMGAKAVKKIQYDAEIDAILGSDEEAEIENDESATNKPVPSSRGRKPAATKAGRGTVTKGITKKTAGKRNAQTKEKLLQDINDLLD